MFQRCGRADWGWSVFYSFSIYLFVMWCTVHIVVVWQFKSKDKLTENTWKIEKIPFRYQWNTFERSRQFPWKTRIIPLKDQENTFERSRKCFWKLRKYLWKIKNSPGRFAGGSMAAFAGLTLCTSCFLNIIFIIFNMFILWFFYLMFFSSFTSMGGLQVELDELGRMKIPGCWSHCVIPIIFSSSL